MSSLLFKLPKPPTPEFIYYAIVDKDQMMKTRSCSANVFKTLEDLEAGWKNYPTEARFRAVTVTSHYQVRDWTVVGNNITYASEYFEIWLSGTDSIAKLTSTAPVGRVRRILKQLRKKVVKKVVIKPPSTKGIVGI